MDQGSLVREQLVAGSRFIDQFKKYAKLQAAFWVKESESGNRSLYLVSDQINDSNFDLAYGEIFRIASIHPDEWLDPFEIKVAGVDDSVAKAVLEIQRKFPSIFARRYLNLRVGDLVADEVYLYPSIKPKQNRKKTDKR